MNDGRPGCSIESDELTFGPSGEPSLPVDVAVEPGGGSMPSELRRGRCLGDRCVGDLRHRVHSASRHEGAVRFDRDQIAWVNFTHDVPDGAAVDVAFTTWHRFDPFGARGGGCAAMGCLLILMTGFAPRLAAILYWIWRPGLWDRAFSGSWIWPVLGILFLPVTTIIWVLVSTNGVQGFDFLWLGLAVVIDLGANGRNAAKRDWSSS